MSKLYPYLDAFRSVNTVVTIEDTDVIEEYDGMTLSYILNERVKKAFAHLLKQKTENE